MKRSNSFKTNALSFLVLLTLAAGQAFAKIPLGSPKGLAVDAKGNLYVANFGNSTITVYNPNYVQVTSKTITANVSYPTGVAFDSAGNSYVSNAGTWSITSYSPTGTPNTAATITSGVQYPTAIAVDGMDDIWVDNDYQTFNVYDATGYLMKSNTTGQVVNTIATHGRWTVIGWENSAYTMDLAGPFLVDIYRYWAVHSQAATAAAVDNSGNAYVGNADLFTGQHSVAAFSPQSLFQFGSFNLTYAPAGIAIDSSRKRAYVSSDTLNKIEVYSIASTNFGTLLSTIQ